MRPTKTAPTRMSAIARYRFIAVPPSTSVSAPKLDTTGRVKVPELRRYDGVPEIAGGGLEGCLLGDRLTDREVVVLRSVERRPCRCAIAVRVTGRGEPRPVALDRLGDSRAARADTPERERRIGAEHERDLGAVKHAEALEERSLGWLLELIEVRRRAVRRRRARCSPRRAREE